MSPSLSAPPARFWRKPLFVYAGANNRLPILPGITLPARRRQAPLSGKGILAFAHRSRSC
jgi:hypothetical protein